MTTDLTISCSITFRRGPRGQWQFQEGNASADLPEPRGLVPKPVRLMALAIRLERLPATSEVHDMMESARIGQRLHPRARINSLRTNTSIKNCSSFHRGRRDANWWHELRNRP